MDYAVCNALGYNMRDSESGKAVKQALIIYDVACQFWIHFSSRLEVSPILQAFYSTAIALVLWAVGKFHLGAHKEECYAAFSINHKPGAGQVDGETMETLWSRLNPLMISARATSHAHRQEKGNTGIGDNAWKKTIRIGWWSFVLIIL